MSGRKVQYLQRAWFSVWRTEIDLKIVRWFAHRFGWHTNICRGNRPCWRPDARMTARGWWRDSPRVPSTSEGEGA